MLSHGKVIRKPPTQPGRIEAEPKNAYNPHYPPYILHIDYSCFLLSLLSLADLVVNLYYLPHTPLLPAAGPVLCSVSPVPDGALLGGAADADAATPE